MNAALAKPIPHVLVYSGHGVDPDRIFVAARGLIPEILAIASVVMAARRSAALTPEPSYRGAASKN
jgi:hypothetical protein